MQNDNQHHTTIDASPERSTLPSELSLKEKHEMLFQRGLRWLGAGIFMMALSFGINFFVQDSEQSVVIAMYIVTSLGAICIMKALVDMLG